MCPHPEVQRGQVLSESDFSGNSLCCNQSTIDPRPKTVTELVFVRNDMIASVTETIRLMIVAGEPSGDAHAASLVKALQNQSQGSIAFFGATGPKMRDCGVETVVRSDDLSILGLLEIGRALPKFWQAFKTLKRAALERRPDAIILVDWPDFNLRFSRWLHRRGFRTIYYISPQVWAWRSHRARAIRRDIDLLLAILPFEPEWYSGRGVPQVEFVGHPLAGQVQPRYGREEFCGAHNLDPARPIISLLPGSRLQELQRILTPMLAAARIVAEQRPEAQFVLVVAPHRSLAEAEKIIAQEGDGRRIDLRIVHHETREALAASDAAAVASGTATLEAALLSTPMVIVYKESGINWHVLGRLITAEHYGLVNLIAGRRAVTELMQNDLNGPMLAEELLRLLDRETNESMRKELQAVASQLGDGGASDRAAQRILKAIEDVR